MSYTPEEIREAGLDDFRVFLYQVWDFLRLPEPTELQLDIAYQLQHGDARQIIQAFRGVGKSWITVAYVLWRLFLNPELKIMVVSASEGNASDFSKFCFQLIEGMPLLQHLRPRRGQRESTEKFDVGPASPSKDPSVKSVGITGQLTGSRADLIVPDDIEVPKNSYTEPMRLKIAELVKEFDAVLKPEGRITYLGTPQIEDSLYNKLIRERGYSVRVWPAEIPKRVDLYRGHLAPLIHKRMAAGWKAGDSNEPSRFPKDDLAARRLSYGAAGYALQFMLDTSLTDIERHPLKLRNLIMLAPDTQLGYMQLAWCNDRDRAISNLRNGGLDGDGYYGPAFKGEQMAPFQGTVMAIDPSGMGKDETAYAIVRYLNGLLYLVDVDGFKDGFGERTLGAIAAAALRHGVNTVIDEPNYGGGMFRSLLKPVLAELKAGSFDEEWKGWASGQKELRILDTLEPIVASHRLVVDPRVIEKDMEQYESDYRYSFVRQFTRIGREKNILPHEDRLEAVAMACGYFAEKMAVNQKKGEERRKDSLRQKEIEDFLNGVMTSGAPKRDRWMKIGRRR